MDPRPIGVFDSGLGGISVLGEAVKLLPNEHFIYYGDTLHQPYGDKTPEEVFDCVSRVFDLLLERHCKAIVIACNTATGVASARLRERYSLPIIGIEPALKPASEQPGEGKIVVLATAVALRQNKFLSLMERYCPDALSIPCPGLMECVEKGSLEGPEVDRLLDKLLMPCKDLKIKAVVLGCTHYPFLKKTIAKHFSPGTLFFDGSSGTARQLKRRLEENDLLSNHTAGTVTFLSSAEGQEPIRQMKTMLDYWLSSMQSGNESE